jgi:hypothetical protein
VKNYIVLCVALALLGCGADDKAEKEQKYAEQEAAAKLRFEQWAYVAKEKQIAPGETIKLVVIPDPQGISIF